LRKRQAEAARRLRDIEPVDRLLPIRAPVKRDFFTAGRAGAIEKNSKPRHDEIW
jgi:hypothetical protein